MINAASTDAAKVVSTENVVEATQKSEDLIKYRPNPDMLVPKAGMDEDVSEYFIQKEANIFYVMKNI